MARRPAHPRRPERRALLSWLVAMVALTAVLCPGTALASIPRDVAGLAHVPPLGGAVASDVRLAPELARLGVTRVVVQAAWGAAEPTRLGGVSPAWVRTQAHQIQEYRAAGLQVVLDPGLQYPPDWVWDLPDARFRNQYGDDFRAAPASGENVPDAVHSQEVRRAQAAYLERLSAALGSRTFIAVRVGGLLTGELRYPRAAYGEHRDSWWAYSQVAQAGSPAKGYVPGLPAGDKATARLFLDDYLSDLTDYQNFLVRATGRVFHAELQVMYPSYGVRPGDIDAAVRAGLTPSTTRFSELVQGADFARMVAALPSAAKDLSDPLVVYSTWLDGPSFGSSDQSASPPAYLVRLAREVGLPVAGENTASSSSDPLSYALCARRVRDLGLATSTWFDDAGYVRLKNAQ